MKRKGNLLLLIAVLLTAIACDNNSVERTIYGKTSGFADSTMLILTNIDNQALSDTTFIIGNEFRFKVKVVEPEEYFVTAKFPDYKENEYLGFWVDYDDIHIEAKKGDFINAQIKGSTIVKQQEELSKEQKTIRIKQDSLGVEFERLSEGDSVKYDSLVTLWNQLEVLDLKGDTSFIRNKPAYLYSAHVLGFKMKYISKIETRSLYDNLSPDVKESKYGKLVNRYLQLGKDLKVGDKAADFTLPDLHGNKISLSSYKGKHVLLTFGAAYCGGCLAEAPYLLKNYRKYKDKGFEILSINIDSNKKNWERAVERDTMIWTSVSDLKGWNGDVSLIYNLLGVPTTYLINPDGVILEKGIRGERIGEKLREIFGE